MMLGGVDFTDLAITLAVATAEVEAVTINYGNFIQTLLDFLIVAWVIFLVVKAMNKMKKDRPEEAATE